MFSANQGKQALPLKDPTAPIVRSGYEGILTNVLSASFVKRSPCAGKIEKIAGDTITVACGTGKVKKKVDIAPEHLRSGSGKDTLSVFNPVVKEKQKVKEGQIIAEGSCISQGNISMGRTLLTAIMPYRGYNFEDGLVINERLVANNGLTSLHGLEEEVLVSEKDRILDIVKIGTETTKGQNLLVKTIGEVEELIGMEEIDDEEGVEIAAGQYIKKRPGGIIVDVEVFSNISGSVSSFPALAALIEKTRKRYGVKSKEKFSVRGSTIKGILIRFRIEQSLKIGLGDKL